MVWKFFVCLFLFLLADALLAQNIKVQTTLDTNKALIGDQINLNIKMFPDENENIIFPPLSDSIGKLLIVSKSKIDTIIEKRKRILNQNIILTSFDSGLFIVPSIEYSFAKGNDTSRFLTDSYQIQYFSVPVDTTKPIKDIKPIMELPFSLMDYFWYIAAGILLIVIGFILYYLSKKWKPKVKEMLPYDPKIPAHVQALKDLNELERQKLWQKGQVKEYHSRLSDILRLYLERRFGFLAMESTTGEIMDYFTQVISSSEITKQLRELLELSDLVKFAKFLPSNEENTIVIDIARNIIQSTIPIDNEDKAESK